MFTILNICVTVQEHSTYFEASLYITSVVPISSGNSMTLVGVGSALLAKIITKGKRKEEGKKAHITVGTIQRMLSKREKSKRCLSLFVFPQKCLDRWG